MTQEGAVVAVMAMDEMFSHMGVVFKYCTHAWGSSIGAIGSRPIFYGSIWYGQNHSSHRHHSLNLNAYDVCVGAAKRATCQRGCLMTCCNRSTCNDTP